MGDVIRSTDVGLRRIVALIEHLDPPARDGLVVFY